MDLRGVQRLRLRVRTAPHAELTGRSLEQIEGSLSAGHFRPDDFAEHTAKEKTAAAKVKVAA